MSVTLLDAQYIRVPACPLLRIVDASAATQKHKCDLARCTMHKGACSFCSFGAKAGVSSQLMKITLLEALRCITLLYVYSMRTSGIQLTAHKDNFARSATLMQHHL